MSARARGTFTCTNCGEDIRTGINARDHMFDPQSRQCVPTPRRTAAPAYVTSVARGSERRVAIHRSTCSAYVPSRRSLAQVVQDALTPRSRHSVEFCEVCKPQIQRSALRRGAA